MFCYTAEWLTLIEIREYRTDPEDEKKNFKTDKLGGRLVKKNIREFIKSKRELSTALKRG